METDRFLFDERVATLQELAAHAVALQTWRSYISQCYSKLRVIRIGQGQNFFIKPKIPFYQDPMSFMFEKSDSNYSVGEDPMCYILDLSAAYRIECDERIKRLQTPRSIEVELLASLKNIQDGIRDWLNFFEIPGFTWKDYYYSQCVYRVHLSDLNCCVWFPTCKIDYVKSTMNLLSTAKLSEVQRFVIAAKYCMVDEIRRLSPDFLNSAPTLNSDILCRDSLLKFWSCYVRFGIMFAQSRNRRTCYKQRYRREIVQYLFRNRNEFAFEYFWSLSYQCRKEMASVVVSSFWPGLQMKFMARLSTTQQRLLIYKMPDQVIMNFIFPLGMPENALSSWEQSKDFITEAQFSSLVLKMIKFDSGDADSKHVEQCHEVLLHIWRTASDNLKNHASKVATDEIVVKKFFVDYRVPSENGYRFFLELLSSTCAARRKSLLFENAVGLAINMPIFYPYLTNCLIELCVPNKDDRMEFERLIMTSVLVKKHLKRLFLLGKKREMNAKLEIFWSCDTAAIRSFKQEMSSYLDEYIETWCLGDKGRALEFINM